MNRDSEPQALQTSKHGLRRGPAKSSGRVNPVVRFSFWPLLPWHGGCNTLTITFRLVSISAAADIPKRTSAAEALSAVGMDDVVPAAVVFWTGAGISFDPPTCAPLGLELTERVLEHLFESGCRDRIEQYYKALRVHRSHPRLETVLDVVHRIIGTDALVDSLSDLRDPLPNDLHRFFARHLDAGGRHITANFDDCIERSGTGRALTPDRLIHFHGSFSLDPTGERLGATLGNVQRGFSADMSERLRHTLTASDVEVVAFVGYSGYDAFDVNPFLRSLWVREELAGKKVVWIRFRSSGEDRVRLNGESSNERIRLAFELLRQAGADCYEIEGDVRAVLGVLAARWHWPTDLPSRRPNRGAWTPAFTPTGDQRRRASLELYAMMGLHTEVRRLFAVRGAETSSELEIAANTVAAEGRYGQAAELWRRAIPGSSPKARAEREQNVASCWWREGRLLKSYWHLRREIKHAEEAGVSGQPLWHLAAIVAHVFGHMRRRPLLRFFVTPRRKRFVGKRLPTDDADGYPSRGPHVDALLTASHARVEGAEQHSDEASTMFDEAEALHGMLNFRHASLRRRGSERRYDLRPSPREYIEQQADFYAIGLFADAVRVPLLPGASRLFSPADVWRGLGGPDFAPWHRLMLFVGYLIRFARGR